MLTKEILIALKEMGWNSKSRDGYRICERMIMDKIIASVLTLKTYQNYADLYLVHYVSTQPFNDAIEIVDGKKNKDSSPIVSASKTITNVSIERKDVEEASAFLIEWALQQDVDAELARMRQWPTDSAGSRPLYHLAALAMAGNVEQLKGYQSSFKRGDRLGFVPYITQDMVDRAVALAEKNVAERGA